MDGRCNEPELTEDVILNLHKEICCQHISFYCLVLFFAVVPSVVPLICLLLRPQSVLSANHIMVRAVKVLNHPLVHHRFQLRRQHQVQDCPAPRMVSDMLYIETVV